MAVKIAYPLPGTTLKVRSRARVLVASGHVDAGMTRVVGAISPIPSPPERISLSPVVIIPDNQGGQNRWFMAIVQTKDDGGVPGSLGPLPSSAYALSVTADDVVEVGTSSSTTRGNRAASVSPSSATVNFHWQPAVGAHSTDDHSGYGDDAPFSVAWPLPGTDITAYEDSFCPYGSCTQYLTSVSMVDSNSNVVLPTYVYQDPIYLEYWCAQFPDLYADPCWTLIVVGGATASVVKVTPLPAE
jgi:hypothetical protein